MSKLIQVQDDTYDKLNQQRIGGKTFDDVIRSLLTLWLATPQEVKVDNGGAIL